MRRIHLVAFVVVSVLTGGCGRTVDVSDEEQEPLDGTSTGSSKTAGDKTVVQFSTLKTGTENHPKFVRIALGAKHSCGLDTKGDVYCWGKNTSFQVGVEELEKVLTPTKVPKVRDAVWIDANANHTCAAVKSGALWCWGQSGPGQPGRLPQRERGVKSVTKVWLGTGGGVCAGFSDGSNCISTAKGVDDSVQWLGGKGYECLAFIDGSVKCRGGNGRGQLGNGTLEESERRWQEVQGLPPVRVTKKRKEARVGAGRNHTCAAVRNGDVYCWGENKYGQLGAETTSVCGGKSGALCETKPRRVDGVANAVDVVSRYDHSCARLASGEVQCWGHERYGVLGAKNPESGTVEGVRDVRQVALGRTHTCVLQRDGSVSCWGMNTDGQAGGGTATRVKQPSKLLWELPEESAEGILQQKSATRERDSNTSSRRRIRKRSQG